MVICFTKVNLGTTIACSFSCVEVEMVANRQGGKGMPQWVDPFLGVWLYTPVTPSTIPRRDETLFVENSSGIEVKGKLTLTHMKLHVIMFGHG